MASPDWPAYYPKYQPFPHTIRRGMRPVPNQQSVDWPQAQFAPLYLPPGSPSFQPYSYKKNDVPLDSQTPAYMAGNSGSPYRQSGVGPDGDIAQLPAGYGDTMHAHANPSSNAAKVRLQLLARQILKFSRKKKTRGNMKVYQRLLDQYKVLKVELATSKGSKKAQAVQTLLAKARKLANEHSDLTSKLGRVPKLMVKRRAALDAERKKKAHAAAKLRARALSIEQSTQAPTFVRQGVIPTRSAIPVGVPRPVSAPGGAHTTAVGHKSASSIPVGYLGNFGDLALANENVPVVRKGWRPAGYGNYGDGMAYELAPVTAMQTYSESVLGGIGGDCGCFDDDMGSVAAIGAGSVGTGALLTMAALTAGLIYVAKPA